MFICSFLKYFKLVEIAMVQVFGSIKDEWCFNYLAFCKSKLCNRFTTNQNLMVRMFPKSCILYIILCMLFHMMNDEQNALAMVWEFRFKALESLEFGLFR